MARRLFAAAVVFSVIFCGIVYLNTRGKVGMTVLDRAFVAAHFFGLEAAPVFEAKARPDHDKVQRVLDRFLARRPSDPTGHLGRLGRFVYCEVFFEDLLPVATGYDNAYPAVSHVKARMKRWKRRLPERGERWYEVFRIKGKPHIRVIAPVADSGGTPAAYLAGVFAVSGEAVKKFRKELFRTLFYLSAVIIVTTALLYPIIMGLMRRVSGLSMDLLHSHLEILNVLGRVIAKRDSDTDAHNYRVTIFSVRLAEELGLSPGDIRGLVKGAFLHDVGKVGIPDRILHKPGPLTDEEFEVMRTHVNKGVNIVEGSDWLKDALSVVVGHHEKADGSGYPAGLKYDRTPLSARIFAIADVFDALTSKRPYKVGFSFEESMGIMVKDSGSHFDPELLETFRGIARSLHDRYANMEGKILREDVEAIVSRYFIDDYDGVLFTAK